MDLEMRSSRKTWVALNPMTSVLRRNRHRGECDVKMQAKVGRMWPQAREHLEPPKAGRSEDGFSSPTSRGGVALLAILILNFRSPEPWENTFLLLSATQFVGICYASRRNLRQDPYALFLYLYLTLARICCNFTWLSPHLLDFEPRAKTFIHLHT